VILLEFWVWNWWWIEHAHAYLCWCIGFNFGREEDGRVVGRDDF
jgi:hypothetical protein